MSCIRTILAVIAALSLLLTNMMYTTEAFVPSSSSSFMSTSRRATTTTPSMFTQTSKLLHDVPSIHPKRKKQRTSSLTMVAPGAVPVAVAAITGAITGGLFAGSLHAISGPDHLAALLPRCCGQRWYRAGRIGALWGMGHGLSATLIGVLAFAIKGRIKNVSALQSMFLYASSITEVAVGVSLVIIGLLGIKEAREWSTEMEQTQPQSLSAAAADPGIKVAQKRAVLLNGVLHGFSWDGAPSLAPALAVATWRGNIAFLLAYALGTMGAMCVTTTLIGEGTRRAGEVFQRPDIPQKLSLGSSVVAIMIGVIWCGLALT